MLCTAASRAVELVSPARFQSYRGNARTHSKKQIRQIARSIERFGFTNPVLAGDDDEIIAGHGRVEAAKLLGLSEVPVLRLSHLSEAERRAYVIADNRLAEKAGWDREILAIELQGLIDLSFEVELTGFATAEIDLVLDEAASAKGGPRASEDRLPLAGQPVSRPGDLWALGGHRLLCASALEADSYRQVLGEERAEVVLTDPPYNVPIDGHVCGSGLNRHREFAQASGEMSEAEFTGFLRTAFEHLARHSTDGALQFVFMDWRHLFEMLTAGRAAYRELKNLVVWNKTNGGMGSLYRSKHELVFVWKAGPGPHVNNVELGRFGRNRSNVWDYAGVNSFGPERSDDLARHPTVKPVAMLADAIRDASRRNGIVLDPFCGSGTVLVAAQQTGRRARAIEIDPIYVDVSVRRWQTYTGKSAVLLATGQSFEEVEDERADQAQPGSGEV